MFEAFAFLGGGYIVGSTIKGMADEVEETSKNGSYPTFLAVSPLLIVGSMIYEIYKLKTKK